MTKTPRQVAIEAWNECGNQFDGKMQHVAAAVISHARPQIEAEMTANMHHFADTVIEKLKGQIEAEARASMAEAIIHDMIATDTAKVFTDEDDSIEYVRALAALPPTHQVVPSAELRELIEAASTAHYNEGGYHAWKERLAAALQPFDGDK